MRLPQATQRLDESVPKVVELHKEQVVKVWQVWQ